MLASLMLTGGTVGVAQAAPTSQRATTATSPSPLSCSGYSCDGLDPAVHCTDGVTVASTWLGPAFLELRYSGSCRTAWARISRAGYVPTDQMPGWAQIHRNSDGRTYRCYVPRGATSCYTKMVNDAGVTSFAEGWYDASTRTYSGRTASY